MSSPVVFVLGMFVGLAVWLAWTYTCTRFVLWRETRGWEDEPEPVTVNLNVDITGFTTVLRQAGAALSKMGPMLGKGLALAAKDMQDSMTRLRESLTPAEDQLDRLRARVAAQREVKVAGLCGRYSVRAGLDPAYADVDNLGALVREILGGMVDGTRHLTTDERRTVAVAAMRGWSDHYQKGAHVPMATVRRYRSAVVTVVAA